MNILASPVDSVIENINQEIERSENPLTTIIKGVDELWDISLMKFIHDITVGWKNLDPDEIARVRVIPSDR